MSTKPELLGSAKLPEYDTLVADPKVRREFDISLMNFYRWDRDERMIALGWPPPIKIGKRNFCSRHALEAFKKGLMTSAI